VYFLVPSLDFILFGVNFLLEINCKSREACVWEKDWLFIGKAELEGTLEMI
jgi:hypothetical protein